MNILITGGAGFIGSHLAKYHIHKGDNVWVIDSLITGQLSNLKEVQNHRNFRFTQEDIIFWQDLSKAISWSDTIYHMAAILGMKYVLSHPIDVLSSNIHSLEKLLLCAKELGDEKKIIVASSSCVYGSNKTSIEDAEETPMIINSGKYLQETYSSSKIINEVMSLCYSDIPYLHIVIARLFNVIGPNQTGRYGMVVPTLIKQALSNSPMTIYGDGSQTRSFCSVHDVVNIFDKLLNTIESKNQVVNIGSECEISIDELAKKIKKMTNSESKLEYVPYEKAYSTSFQDVKRRKPNTNKMATLIGIKALTPLEDILDEIIDSLGK